MPSVLDGVRVIDLSWGVAGPAAGMSGTTAPTSSRWNLPAETPFGAAPDTTSGSGAAGSLELGLRSQGPRETLWSLVDTADVVLESFGPGTARRLGADAETLLRRNPSLVHCTISAYGQLPDAQERPGLEALVAAPLGILDEQRGHSGSPIPFVNREDPFLPNLDAPVDMYPGADRGASIFAYTPWLSMEAAFLALVGINAALFAGLETGRGQHVETSLLQAALGLTAIGWQRVEHNDDRAIEPRSLTRGPQGVLPLLRQTVGRQLGSQSPFRSELG